MRTNDCHLALGATIALGKLCSHTHGMAELSLATSELAIHLADAAGLKTATKDLVPIVAASAEAEASLALVK